MKVQVDIKPTGQITMEVLERAATENCGDVSHRLVQGMSIESDETIGPDCDEVHETTSGGSL